MKCEVILPKNEMMGEYCFYRTLSIHLQSDQLASRRTVALSTQRGHYLLAISIHPLYNYVSIAWGTTFYSTQSNNL